MSFAGLTAPMPELIALGSKVRHLKLDFTSGARSILAGAHVSRFRGRGMDFAESREYQPGDDVRHIDWRVTARTGRTHTKLYTEERERPVFVVMDFNPGMFFGTRGAFKSVTAARAAACVAWSVVQQGDRIGCVTATPAGVMERRPAAGRRGALQVLAALNESTTPYGKFAVAEERALLGDALRHALRVVHPGSLVIIFSDFYQQDDDVRRSVSRLRAHNDLVACQVLDTVECSVPAAGQYLITDGGDRQFMDTRGHGASARYRQMIARRDEGLSNLLSGLAVPLVRLRGDHSVLSELSLAFGGRKTRAAVGPRNRVA